MPKLEHEASGPRTLPTQFQKRRETMKWVDRVMPMPNSSQSKGQRGGGDVRMIATHTAAERNEKWLATKQKKKSAVDKNGNPLPLTPAHQLDTFRRIHDPDFSKQLKVSAQQYQVPGSSEYQRKWEKTVSCLDSFAWSSSPLDLTRFCGLCSVFTGFWSRALAH